MRRDHASILIVTLMLSTLLAFLIVNSDSSISDTVIGEGHITLDTVWDLSNSTYYIEGNVTVDYGVNLTIEPGVEVFFNGYYNLYIEGNLSAVGNESDMIKFTSNESIPSFRDWEGIQVNATGYINIRYCNISYANSGISISQSEKENKIQDSSITNNWIGIRIFESTNCTLKNNNVSDNYNHGILLSYSPANLIQDNYLTNNGRLSIGNGLHLHYSDDNIILNNIIWNNRFRGIYLFWSNYNDMRFNWIYSNLYNGVYITQSRGNLLRNNNISLNGYSGNYPGINLTISSQDNLIFHNTIIDNAVQANDGTNNSNQWDDDYPNGGNFWSDYSGVDNNRSEQQDVPGSDGLGDDPYFIDLDSYDRYPLMNKLRNIAPFLIALISPLNESVIKPGTVIDLDILVQDYTTVNYSVNGGINTSLDDPFDVNTSTWFDGYNRLDVYVNDDNGSYNFSWFSFIFDSTKPIILLVSPQNNSVFRAGEIINLSIIEPNIKSTNYYLNGSLEQALPFPYEFNTSLWPDGNYSLEIHAEDVADNTNSTLFVFVLDSSPPVISMDSPFNNSYIKPGTLITFSILDDHLDTGSVTYQIHDQGAQTFTSPYTINTLDWEDGNYKIFVNCRDILGNSISRSFNITIDSIAPSVFLLDPLNNSVIRKETFLTFSVSDESPISFSFSLNMGVLTVLPSPYELDTSTFDDGVYRIDVNVSDYADNFNRSWYNITIDSIEPVIDLVSLTNNSYIRVGHEIVFDIEDATLLYANFSVNGGDFESFIPSFSINTTSWPEGTYTIEVVAMDAVGNDNSVIYVFNLDNSPPKVVATNPKNNADNIKLNTSIIIQFNEIMNKTSVRQAISISPDINYNTGWSSDNLTLVIVPATNLSNSTLYTIIINTSAKDTAGNALRSNFELIFNTGSTPKSDWIWVIFPILLVIILASIIILILIYRRSGGTSKEQDVQDKDEFDVKAKEKGLDDEIIEDEPDDELDDEIVEDEPDDKLGKESKEELGKEPKEEDPKSN